MVNQMSNTSSTSADAQHPVVFYDPSKWAAVPANNGANGPAWQWGDELLVGFTVGEFANAPSGHQCSYDHPFVSWLARSSDGGESWTTWTPDGYVGCGGKMQALDDAVDFTGSGFVMRVEGHGYHGNDGIQWFYSDDRGERWHGPYGFGNLMDHPKLEGLEFTGRTAYLVNGQHELYMFASARDHEGARGLSVALSDKPFVARTVDGGKSWEFMRWIVPPEDRYRAVMPAPVQLTDRRLIVAVRRKSELDNWIDCYESLDNGLAWSFVARVGATEANNEFNGNPPALIQLADGRLACAYGDRSLRQIIVKYSDDEGQTWGPGQIVRDDFQSVNGHPDLGYPRLFQRSDGKLVVVYFWCTAERPQTHIAATIFAPSAPGEHPL